MNKNPGYMFALVFYQFTTILSLIVSLTSNVKRFRL